MNLISNYIVVSLYPRHIPLQSYIYSIHDMSVCIPLHIARYGWLILVIITEGLQEPSETVCYPLIALYL